MSWKHMFSTTKAAESKKRGANKTQTNHDMNKGVYWPTSSSSVTELDHQDIHWPHTQTQIAVCIKPQLHRHKHTHTEPCTGSNRVTEIWKKKKNLDRLTSPPAALSSNPLPDFYLFSLPPNIHTSFPVSIIDCSSLLPHAIANAENAEWCEKSIHLVK